MAAFTWVNVQEHCPACGLAPGFDARLYRPPVGEADLETGAASGGAVGADEGAVLGGDAGDEGEAEAGAAVVASAGG